MAKKTVFETATSTYTAGGSIGDGGSGTVYRVTDDEGAEYALKLLLATTADKRKRFKNELAFCRKNQHAQIVRVLDEGVLVDGEQRRPFYVMPLYDSTLRKLIVAGTPVPGALELFSQVLDGVEAAHFQNVMHRDLKPENLLVRLAEKRVAVADFGIAHFEEEDLFTTVETRAADRLGNYAYSAPEQRTRGRAVDHRADIFALGLILNELFTGEVAQGTGYRTIASVAPDFAYLDPLVAKMIRQNPAERPGSIRDIKDELMLRGAEFVAHQRLDQATMTVVPTIASNDPLAGVDVAAGEFYYEPGMLRFRLLPPPPPKWFDTLQGLQAFSFIDGLAEPRLVGRDGRGAFIQAGAHNVELIAGLVKQWVQSANSEYRKRLRHEAQEEERRQREQLAARQRRLAEEERGNERLRKALLQ